MKLLYHGFSAYRENANFGPACWPNHDLFTVKNGLLNFQTAAGSITLRNDDAVWIPPHVKFWGRIEKNSTMIRALHFRSPKQVPPIPMDEIGAWVLRGGMASELAMGLTLRLQKLYLGNSLWKESAEDYFQALLAEVLNNARNPQHADSKLWQDIIQWAHDHLSRGIGVEDMARYAGFSESYFRTLFQKRMGRTAGKFLLDMRMHEAQQLLRQTTLNLKEISSRLGYGDHVAFHRAFTSRFHITPAKCRREWDGKV